MTPTSPNASVVIAKLKAIEDALQRLESYRGSTAADLTSDFAMRSVVERLMQVIVDLAFDVNGHLAVSLLGRAPHDGRSSFRDVVDAGVIPADLGAELAPAAGFRNVLVHQYVEIDIAVVAASIESALDLFPRYVASVGGWLAERERSDD